MKKLEQERIEVEKNINQLNKDLGTIKAELGDTKKREEHQKKEAETEYKDNTLKILTQIAKETGDKLIDLSRFAEEFIKSEDKSQKMFGLTIRGLIGDMKNTGIRVMGEAGEEVPFEPGDHNPVGVKIEKGETVVIETPGLAVNDSEGRVEVITKALVLKSGS